MSQDQELRKVYVDSVEVLLPDSTHKREIKLVVKGYLPSSAYRFHHSSVRTSKKQIDLTPLASFDENVMAAQTLVAFQDTVTITPKRDKGKKMMVKLHGIKGTKAQIIVVSE
jgi:hypothetical protein